MAAKVGEYLLLDTIGHGAFGKVKLGVHQETGERVAVKIMDKSDIQKQDLTQNVRREITIMKALNHKNIVRLYQVLTTSTKIYVVMELVTGGELLDVISRHKHGLKERAARRYFQQLVDGVVYCHRRKVYHRDLKPENILLSESKEVKVTDFGLSSITRSKQGEKDERFLKTQCGTPCYVAPEVIYAASEGYSGEKADGWACGVVLYALLTGSLPFDSDELGELFMMIMNTEPHYPEHLSKGAKDLLKKMLHKDPKRRIGLRQVRQHPWFLKNYEGDADEGSRPRRKKQRRVEEDASTNNPAILDDIASPLAEGGNAGSAAQDISASVSERTDGEIETSPEKRDMDVIGVSHGLQSPGRSLVANIASMFEARDKEDQFVACRPSPKKAWTRREEPVAPTALPLSANLESMTGGSADGEQSNERALADDSKAGTLRAEADENMAAPVAETTSPEDHEADTVENVGDMREEAVRVSDDPDDAAGDGGFVEEDPAHVAAEDELIITGNKEAAHEDLDPPEDERMDEDSTDGVHAEKQDIYADDVDFRSQMSVTDIMQNGIFGRPSLQWVGSPSRVLKQGVFSPMEDKRDRSVTRSGATVGFDLGNREELRDSCRFEDEDAEDNSLHGSSQAVWARAQPTAGLAKPVSLGAGASSVSYYRHGTASNPSGVQASVSDGLDALRRKFEDYECMDSGPDDVEILSRDHETPMLTREIEHGEIAAERDGKQLADNQVGEKRTDLVVRAANRLQPPSVELSDREGAVTAERGSSSVSADHDSDRAHTVGEGNGEEPREATALSDTREDSSPKRDDEDDEEAYEIIEEIPDTDSEEEAEYIEIEVPVLASAPATSGSEDRPSSGAMTKDIAQLTLQPKNLEENSRKRSEELHVAGRGEEEAVSMDVACEKGIEDVACAANGMRLEESPGVDVDKNRRGTDADPRSEKGAVNEGRVDAEGVGSRGYNVRAEVVAEETSDGEEIEFYQTTVPAASLQAKYGLEGHEIRMRDAGESPNTSKRDFGWASRQGFETSGEVEVLEIPAADLAEFEHGTNIDYREERAGPGKVEIEDGAVGLREDVDMAPGGELDDSSVGVINNCFSAEGTLADDGASYAQNENGAQIGVGLLKVQGDVDMIPEEPVDEIEEDEEDDDEIGEGLTKLTSEQQGEFFAIRRLQTVIAMAKTADLEKKDRKSFSRVVSFQSSSKSDDPSRNPYLEDRRLTLSALNTVKDKLETHPDLAAALTNEEMREFERLVLVWEMQLQESSFSHVEQPVISEEMVAPLQKLLRVWDANLTGSFAAEEVEDVGKNSSYGGDSEVWEDDEYGSSEEEVVVDREFDIVGDENGQGAERDSGLCAEDDDNAQGVPMKLGSKSAVLVGNRKQLADPRSASLPDVQAPPARDSFNEGQGEDENADSRASFEGHDGDRVEPKLGSGVLGSDSMNGLLGPRQKGKVSGKKPNIPLTNSVVRDSARFRVPEDVETRSPVGAENSPSAYAATGSPGWSGGAVSPLKESNASRIEDGPSSGGGLFVGQAFSGDQIKKKPAQRGVVRKWKNLVGFKQQRKYTQFDTAYSPDLALQEMGKLFLRDTDADNVFKRQNENKLKCSVKTARGQMMVTVEFFGGKGARGSTLVLFKQSKPSTNTITFNNFFDSAKESFATLAPNAVLE